MIDRAAFYGRAKQLCGNGPHAMNPDVARFLTVYPVTVGVVRIPEAKYVRHWKPGLLFTIVNDSAGILDVDVQLHTGTSLYYCVSSGPQVVLVTLMPDRSWRAHPRELIA